MNGTHRRGDRQPIDYPQVVPIAGPKKATIGQQIPHRFNSQWSRLATEICDESSRKRSKPTPRLAKDASPAFDEVVDLPIARDESRGQRACDDPGRIHGKNRRQNTPTSLVRRELLCVERIDSSRDEILTIHDPPGYPRRGWSSGTLDPGQLGVLRRRNPSYRTSASRTCDHNSTTSQCVSTRSWLSTTDVESRDRDRSYLPTFDRRLGASLGQVAFVATFLPSRKRRASYGDDRAAM